MKKIYKFLVFILMLALAIGSVVISPATLFAASTALVGASIVLTKMPTTGKINTVISIPVGTTTTSGSTVTVKVTDPVGKEVATNLNGDHYEFTATMIGDYKVVYTASETGSNSKTTSEVYTIKVTGEKATLSFDANSPFIMQSKIGLDSTIVLPYPNVSLTGEEKDAVPGHYTGDDTTDANITVTVTDPYYNTWAEDSQYQDYTNPLGVVTIDGQKYYTFKATTKIDGEKTVVRDGYYSVYFKYVNSETNVVVTKSQKILVSDTYNASEKITFTWEGSLPESAVLGNEVTLPKPVTVDEKTGDSVQTYTKVEVTYHNGETKEEVDVNNFKFTPMFEAKNGSYYTLTYKIYTLEALNLANATSLDSIDDATPTLEKSYTLSNVTDTVAPKPKAVNAYAVEDNGTLLDTTIDALEDEEVSYLIPSKARTQVEITIPAVYATDNYSNYKDLTITRTLIDENGTTYSLDGESTLNADDDTKVKVVQSKVNQNAIILFRTKGTYTIRYRATDKANNSSEVSYKIVVSDTLVDDLAPHIVMPTIDGTIKPTETLTFAAPTIVDYKDDHENGATTVATIDTNVKKDVYYFYGKADSTTDFDAMLENNELTKVAKDANDTTKYALVVDENPSANYLTVVVRAEDDAKYSTGRTENNVSYKYKVITIYNVNDDVAPTLETGLLNIATALDGVYGQNEVVSLNQAIEFTDDDANGDATQNLVASLKVYDKNGNEITVSGVKYIYDGSKYSVENGKFVTTVAGTYQVVITATDLGGNSLVNSFQFEVNDTKAPVIEVENIQTTMELGKTYKLPAPVVKDDGIVIENLAYSQVEFGDDCPSYLFNQGTLEFTPKEEGIFTFRYVAKDNSNNDATSSYFTITVSDTIAPVIVINETAEYTIPETAQYKDANGNVVNVNLPFFTATDENGIKSLSVTVTYPDGDEKEADLVTDHYEFTPNKNGVYKVTYKAVDMSKKSSTEIYTIQVGDVVVPSLQGVTAPSSFKIGDTLSVKLSDLTVVDDTDGETAGATAVNNNKLNITLTGPNGSSLDLTKTNDVYTHEFETAGTYKLQYTVKDEAGNTDNVTYTFEVKSTTNSGTVSEVAWGVALIVASIALIAGVIVYFVRTKDAPVESDKKKEDK